MPFEFRPARRDNIWWLLGLAGGTGSGKTFSAMRLAKGMAGDKPFAVIDTENGRALHYADQFRFDHCPLTAPYRPHRYGEAILAAAAAGYDVIVVDSTSHEHAGEGGVLDWQEEEFERLTKGKSESEKNAYKMLSWQAPKRDHKKLVNEVLLQVRAHVICCFRAEPKTEMAKENGRTVVREKSGLMAYEGWCPITDKNLPFEMTAYFMFKAEQPGVPIPIKLQEQHKAMFPRDQVLTEQAGRLAVQWARGGVQTWPDRIAAASSRAELEQLAKDIAAAEMSEPERAVVRALYTERWNGMAARKARAS